MYEWVEDEIEENGSILASEVRERAGLIIGKDFANYNKFHWLSKRIKEWVEQTNGLQSGKCKLKYKWSLLLEAKFSWVGNNKIIIIKNSSGRV